MVKWLLKFLMIGGIVGGQLLFISLALVSAVETIVVNGLIYKDVSEVNVGDNFVTFQKGDVKHIISSRK